MDLHSTHHEPQRHMESKHAIHNATADLHDCSSPANFIKLHLTTSCEIELKAEIIQALLLLVPKSNFHHCGDLQL